MLAEEHYGRIVEPNHLERSLDILRRLAEVKDLDDWLERGKVESAAMPDHARQRLLYEWFEAAYVEIDGAEQLCLEADPEFEAIFTRTLAEIGESEEIRQALQYRASLCSCPCHQTGDPLDCPTKFCTYGSGLCASEMNARLNHHGNGGVAAVGGDGDTPSCCGPMISIGTGRAAGFDIEVWRCLTCGWHQSTAARVDGGTFWVGAMARAISNEELRIIADSGGGSPPTDPARDR